VSAAEQAALPTALYLLGDNLCLRPPREALSRLPQSVIQSEQKLDERARREYAALRAALASHPDSVVTASATLADPAPNQPRIQHQEITVRKLAESFLEPPITSHCERVFRTQLTNLLAHAG
jgi:hypothetical protein